MSSILRLVPALAPIRARDPPAGSRPYRTPITLPRERRDARGRALQRRDPQGTIGSDGVAWTGFPGVYLIAEGEPTFDALAAPGAETADPAAETQEHLLVSVEGTVFPWVDLGEQERLQNPDKAQLDSNPNAVIVVDPTPTGEPATTSTRSWRTPGPTPCGR